MSFTHTHAFPIDAAPARVFAALVEPDQLTQWFAQYARVEPHVGGAYAFWGKHTLDGAGSGAGQQRLLALEPERLLRFSWRLAEQDTTVQLALEPTDATCTLTVTHEVPTPLPWPRPRPAIDDWWRLSMGNLMQYVAGATALVRVDFTDPAPVVHQVVDIAAPPAVVFRALTEPALVAQWFGAPAPVIDPRAGGAYVLGWRYEVDGREVQGGPTTILAYEPDRRLVLDWPDWRGDTSTAPQRITFVLEPTATGTRLTFTHEGFERPVDISDYGFGWTWFLRELTRVAGTVAAT